MASADAVNEVLDRGAHDPGAVAIVCERLRALPLPVFLLPDRSVSPILSQPTLEFGSQFVIELQRAPLSRLEMAQKRAFDLGAT